MVRKICKENKSKPSQKEKDSKYFCKSCGEGSDKEKQLCKPKKNP